MVGITKPVDIVKLAVFRFKQDALLGGIHWKILVVIINLQHWFGLISSWNWSMYLWMLTVN